MSLFRVDRGSGPDLVLLHGWGLHGGIFGPLVTALAPVLRLHALDLPGHGGSPWSKGCGDLEGLARRVAEHLPERCHLLGWSLGGMVAVRLATLFPARIERLVLVATTPRFLRHRDWLHGQPESVLSDVARRLARDWRGTVQDFLALQLRGDERPLDALRELRQSLLAHGEPSTGALAAGLEILRSVDLRGELGRVRAPTLVVAGQHDRLTPPPAAAALAAGIPGARLETLAGAAHAPFLTRRGEFEALLRDFLGVA